MPRRVTSTRIEFQLNHQYNCGPQEWHVVDVIKNQTSQMLLDYRGFILDGIKRNGWTTEELVQKLVSDESYLWWLQEYLPSDRAIRVGIYGEEQVVAEEKQLERAFELLPVGKVPFSAK